MAIDYVCPFTHQDLANLDLAIASGAMEVEFAGKRTRYRSYSHLLRARNYVWLSLCKKDGQKISRPGAMRPVCTVPEPCCSICGCSSGCHCE